MPLTNVPGRTNDDAVLYIMIRYSVLGATLTMSGNWFPSSFREIMYGRVTILQDQESTISITLVQMVP